MTEVQKPIKEFNIVALDPCFIGVLQYQDLKNIILCNSKYRLLRDLEFYAQIPFLGNLDFSELKQLSTAGFKQFFKQDQNVFL